MDKLASQSELTQAREVENVAVLVPIQEDA
jgi:hypothetical protein